MILATPIELKIHSNSIILTSFHVCLALQNIPLSFQTVNSLFAIIHLLFFKPHYSSSKESPNRHIQQQLWIQASKTLFSIKGHVFQRKLYFKQITVWVLFYFFSFVKLSAFPLGFITNRLKELFRKLSTSLSKERQRQYLPPLPQM